MDLALLHYLCGVYRTTCGYSTHVPLTHLYKLFHITLSQPKQKVRHIPLKLSLPAHISTAFPVVKLLYNLNITRRLNTHSVEPLMKCNQWLIRWQLPSSRPADDYSRSAWAPDPSLGSRGVPPGPGRDRRWAFCLISWLSRCKDLPPARHTISHPVIFITLGWWSFLAEPQFRGAPGNVGDQVMGSYGGSLASQVKDEAGVSLVLPRGLWVILCRVSDWRNRPTPSPPVLTYTLKNMGPSWNEKKKRVKNSTFLEMALWLLRH